MLMYICFKVSLVVIGTANWSMTRVPNCTGTCSLYLWSKTAKNNTSSLYQGKPGLLRLVLMYPLYGIEIMPNPSRCNKFPWGGICHQISKWNPSIRMKTWDPESTSAITSIPSTTTIFSLEWQICHTKGLGLWYHNLQLACQWLPAFLILLHSVVHPGDHLGGVHNLPQIFI